MGRKDRLIAVLSTDLGKIDIPASISQPFKKRKADSPLPFCMEQEPLAPRVTDLVNIEMGIRYGRVCISPASVSNWSSLSSRFKVPPIPALTLQVAFVYEGSGRRKLDRRLKLDASGRGALSVYARKPSLGGKTVMALSPTVR